jgi:hypothetical protein
MALRVLLVSLVASAALAPAASALPPPAVFTSTGAEQAYVVPDDVTLVAIDAIGAAGGGGCGGGTGGLGGQVTARFAVSPGSVLFVEVGDVGAPGALPGGFCSTTSTESFNGGGGGGPVGAGGGGGASDVRTVPRIATGTSGSRLIVAGGGGGAGSAGLVPGGAGGDAGSGGGGARAGGGATLDLPGAAGTSTGCNADAVPGTIGLGGDGSEDFPNNGGGGGGGGYWGGGGGGCTPGAGGAGGGGGSNYVAPQAVGATLLAAEAAPASVTIAPVEPPPLPQGPPGPAGRDGAQGPPGPVVEIERLSLVAFDTRLRARPGARIRLRYVSTVAAAVELRLLKGRRALARVRGRAKAGRNRIGVRAPRTAGRYTLQLSASANGRRDTERIRLRVSAP